MKLGYLLLVVVPFLLKSCNTTSSVTHDDKHVFHLIKKAIEDPRDRDLVAKLNLSYGKAKSLKLEEINYALENEEKGDRQVTALSNFLVLQQMYDQISASQELLSKIPNCEDFTQKITETKNIGAEEYFMRGEVNMKYGKREFAQKAHSFFEKCSELNSDYKGVYKKMEEAKDAGTMHVVIGNVRYTSNRWEEYGFERNLIQQSLMRDLSVDSYEYTEFYLPEDLARQNKEPDMFIDLNMNRIWISRVDTRKQEFNRKHKGSGDDEGKEFRAKVKIHEKRLTAEIDLTCRITDKEETGDVSYESYKSTFEWEAKWATYSGDNEALTNTDHILTRKKADPFPPSQSEISETLLEKVYYNCRDDIKELNRFK